MQVNQFNFKALVCGLVLSLVVASGAFASDTNLVGYWRLDGNALDSSDYMHHGTVYGAPNWITEGEVGGCIQLNEFDAIGAVGYKGIAGSHARTCSAWIKTTISSGEIIYWGSTPGAGWTFGVNGNGRLRAAVESGYIYGTTPIADGQWHHVAVTLADDGSTDISEAILYVDGSPENPGQVTACPVNTAISEDVRMGLFFQGLLDDVRLYDRALTEAEVAGLVGPVLNAAPSSFVFIAEEEGTNPADQTLTISNPGGGTLNWSINTSGKPAWLTIASTSGSLANGETENVTLSVSTAGLADGFYFYAFQVTDPGAANSPRAISVVLNTLNTESITVPGAYATIQAAIDGVSNGQTVVVFPGTYYENINFKGKNIVLTSTNPEDPDVVAGTIINGGWNGSSVVTFAGTETANCVLRGFTITNGYAMGGAGISGSNTHATIAYCAITHNRAPSLSAHGGGLCNCDGAITHCTISDNYSELQGGGADGCDGVISQCIITGNTAPEGGGGLNSGLAAIDRCTIARNTSQTDGGGLRNCDGTIANCLIIANSALVGGGLSVCDGPITNCIIWGNSVDQLSGGSTPAYSCIQDWTGGGVGNISSDPLFADAVNGDYHLKSQFGRWDPNTLQWVQDAVTSPCIDAGDPASDWTAELWPHGALINMGAYGGTPEASMSGSTIGNIADLDCDDYINANDLTLLGADWLLNEYLLGTDLNRDGHVNLTDFSGFAGQWLMHAELPRYLSAPGGLTATPYYEQIFLNWNDHPSPYWAGFNVYRSEPNHPEYVLIAEDMAQSEYADLYLTNGVTYSYRVTAISTTGNESPAAVVSVAPNLAAPAGLSTMASYGQVSLNWNDDDDPFWAGFNVYRSTTSGSGYVQIAENLQVSDYTDLSVTNGINYYYVVTAMSTTGNESTYSSQVSARPGQLESQGFETSMGNWANVTSGDTDQWTRDSGGTGIGNTGPSTGANGSGWYTYMETSSAGGAFGAGDSAILQGPQVTYNGRTRVLNFYYHMYGVDMGTLNVDVYSGSSWTNGVWSRSGQKHTSKTAPYTQATVNLSAYTGTIRVRFRGVAAGGSLGDMAIDDILIYEQ